MKKMVTMLLAAATLFGATALAENDLPIVTEPLTLTIAVERHSADASTDFNEKAFAIKAEEETGIHINWIEVSGYDDEKMSVLLSGTHPDVYMGVLSDAQIAENASLFLPIGDLMQEYCPNVMATYEQMEGWKDFLTYPDGNIYGMGIALFTQEDPNETVYGMPWINKAWLDKLGLDMPTTTDELYEVLKAFKENDMDGDGDPNNEIPFNFCAAHWANNIGYLAYPWGLTMNKNSYYNIEDGKVVANVTTEAFREFLEYYHKLGEEGLFNLEGFSSTVEQYNAQMDSMSCGVFIGWGPNNVITNSENWDQFEAFTPIHAEGYKACLMQISTKSANRNGFVISADSPNWEAALKWWNYLSSSQEMAYFVQMGPEGINWEVGEDGHHYLKQPTDEELKAAGYDKYVGKAGTSSLIASLGAYMTPPVLLEPAVERGDPRREALAAWTDYLPKTTMSKRIVPADRQEEFVFTTEGLEDCINSFMASSIMDGVTDESWAAFKDEVAAKGYDYYLQYYQDMLDGTF